MDMALAIQEVTEEIVMRIVSTAKQITHATNLVLAGGVALNCVANSKILAGGIFDNVWVQPAAGDAGGALGAAYIGAFLFGESNRKVHSQDSMRGSYLGPAFSDEEAIRVAHKYGAPFRVYSSEEELYTETAGLLAGGHVVGWFQGRMEWGPRALGNRSILGDPRDVHMQKKLNLKIKFREGFRPFAPSVLVEDMEEYFDWSIPSPYMLFVAPVKKELRKPYKADGGLYERLYSPRSDLPAITHMDYSARLQTVDKNDNEKYWKLINAFKQITGYGVVINTSFNVRGEPIVCTPLDAYKCFMSSDMDYVVIGNVCFSKKDQPETLRSQFTQQAHALD
jgi:carbamoyltransferase